jgi:hypothetical protein
MNFKYGKTEDEIAEIRANAPEMNWHKCFAWFPVDVGGGEYRWLEIVRRRYTFYHPRCGFTYPKYSLLVRQVEGEE